MHSRKARVGESVRVVQRSFEFIVEGKEKKCKPEQKEIDNKIERRRVRSETRHGDEPDAHPRAECAHERNPQPKRVLNAVAGACACTLLATRLLAGSARKRQPLLARVLARLLPPKRTRDTCPQRTKQREREHDERWQVERVQDRIAVGRDQALLVQTLRSR